MKKDRSIIWLIIFSVIVSLVLTVECIAVFTDAFDLPLSRSQINGLIREVTYDLDGGNSFFDEISDDVSMSGGEYPMSYIVVSSYSQYQDILEALRESDADYADALERFFYDVGYNRAYFNKYSIIFVENTQYNIRNFYISSMTDGTLSLSISGSMAAVDGRADIYAIPVSAKDMGSIDKIVIDY